MGRKIEAEETVSHKSKLGPSNFCAPRQSGAHGTSHACHTLDTPLFITVKASNRAKVSANSGRVEKVCALSGTHRIDQWRN